MNYLALNLIVLAIVAVVAAFALRRRPRLIAPIALTVVVLFVLTAVFDNIMIAVGLMVYSDTGRSGIDIGLAPIEDFAYPLAGALLLPSIWVLLSRGERDE
ncbi:lycopene cyclase domain-containing protein [Leifsonia sp. YIM 134122]|uniref:Lycopene cyclase domain-containing protein n=1 Tax=Leifsonia stereocauli TaxID=3134136 RepID=A0ABU9W5L2_9MICO